MIALVLFVAALAGARILGLFGVSLDVFSVAGGVVLPFIGFRMIVGNESTHHTHDPQHATDASAGGRRYAPLILFAASPGTITGVITVAAAHSENAIPTTALIAIAVVLLITLGLLLAGSKPRKSDQSRGSGLARDRIGRYMVLIVVAIGIQFILNGYKAFMAG